MIELLEKLSRLDPKICDRYKDGFSLNCYSASGNVWMTVLLHFEDLPYELPPKSLACMQSALQQAIANYPGLHYRLQNSSDGVRASVWNAEDESITFDRVDAEPAIALLAAYVLWLEWIEVREWLKPAITQ